MALARKSFARPLELLSSKPIYENWKEGGEDAPAYWETTFFGHTYQMGSVAAAFSDGDVGVFKLLADNTQRGVDFFTANTGGDWVTPGKYAGDQVGQYRNLLIWLRPVGDRPFLFQLPKTALMDREAGIFKEHYGQEVGLRASMIGNTYSGFALEVGEFPTYPSYEAFKQAVKEKSRLDLGAIAQGTVELTSSTDATLKLTHNSSSELPTIIRNGNIYRWLDHLALYEPMGVIFLLL